jgi:hypothetical protein
MTASFLSLGTRKEDEASHEWSAMLPKICPRYTKNTSSAKKIRKKWLPMPTLTFRPGWIRFVHNLHPRLDTGNERLKSTLPHPRYGPAARHAARTTTDNPFACNAIIRPDCVKSQWRRSAVFIRCREPGAYDRPSHSAGGRPPARQGRKRRALNSDHRLVYWPDRNIHHQYGP